MDQVGIGAVFAAGVQGIHIRVANVVPEDSRAARLSLAPSPGTKSALAAPGTILVTGTGGTGLFGALLPLVGNSAWMELIDATTDSPMQPLFPSSDRALAIAVWQPSRSWVRLTWDNRTGGVVEGVFADGSTRSLGRVLQPLAGVGRFDGTPLSGHGRTASIQPGSWVVSTVDRFEDYRVGVGKERRGGFRVQSTAGRMPPGRNDATLLFETDDKRNETTNPTVQAGWELACHWSEGARWECRIDDSPWMPLPIATGPRISAFTGDDWAAAPFRLGGRPIRKGVTALRVHLPPRSPEMVRKLVDDLVRNDRARRAVDARLRGTPVVQGRYVVRVRPTDPSRVRFVRLSVDGRVVAFSNVAPFDLPWDTTRVSDGEYTLVVEILDNSGAAIATTTRSVVVDNSAPPGTRP